jgi:GrpB-like predicted nucleotidyltransferase (UPF0157 family)
MHWSCKPHSNQRTTCTRADRSGRFRDELTFRDRLRADPAAAVEYAALKHELAVRFSNDREPYTGAKTAFVRRILESA